MAICVEYRDHCTDHRQIEENTKALQPVVVACKSASNGYDMHMHEFSYVQREPPQP